MNISSNKKFMGLVALPQCVMSVLLTLIFIKMGEYPSTVLIVLFVFRIILNIAVYSIAGDDHENVDIKVLYSFLAGLLIIFSVGIYMIYKQFSSVSVISPETLYIICNSVPMIYLSAAIIKKTDPAKNINISSIITLCLALPVAIYILSHSSHSFADISIILAIGLVCVFWFLLSKLGFILYIKFKKTESEEEVISTSFFNKNYIFIAVLALLLPQVGLGVNGNLFGSDNLLGDFSSGWFHLIAALNGLLLFIDMEKIKYKLPLFYLKTVGFAYICYFAFIFIPYMPYAIIGILFYGLGLLVYVPAAIFIVQLRQIFSDYKLIRNIYQRFIILIIAVMGFLTLPLLLVVNFSIDRINFNNAMSYVEASHNSQQKVDFGRLERSINQIEATMLSSRRQGGLIFMTSTPIISTVYRYVAFDNMFFTDETVLKLQKIFIPDTIVSLSETMRSDAEPNYDFSTKLSISQVEYDIASGTYKAWVDFEVTQLNNDQLGEYRTKFVIPDGCFITDYYLYVGNEKKRGIITDKRAAQIAYESIIRTPKDPGILYYENDHTIALRVYPFNGNETRRTGFQIMFSQNETLHIEGQSVNLVAENSVDTPIIMDGIHFIPLDYKKTLTSIERKPLYYFLLDAGNKNSYLKHLEMAKQYTKEEGINSRYYAVSYQVEEIMDISSSKLAIQSKGGFNTAYAMSEILPSVPEGYFPIILLITENINRAIPLEKIQLATDFPEVDCYYRLNDDFSLTPYRFYDSERLNELKQINTSRALNYNGTAISDKTSETIITNSDFTEFTGNQYMDAFILQKNTFLSDTDEMEILFIRESMQRRLLTKNTSFIVMETKEQEDMLLSLQEQFLKGESEGTPSVMMSEPMWAIVITIIGLIIFIKSKSTSSL